MKKKLESIILTKGGLKELIRTKRRPSLCILARLHCGSSSYLGCERLLYSPVPNKSPLTAERVWVLLSSKKLPLAWGPGLCDVAAWNAAHLDLDFEQMLVDDGDQDEWDKSTWFRFS